MNTKLSESNGEPCTWRHVSTVRGQALENLPSKDGKALSAEPTQKIDGSFSCGYGTILYFEDMSVVHALQEQFPTYKDNFPVWAEQADAMHQFVIIIRW